MHCWRKKICGKTHVKCWQGVSYLWAGHNPMSLAHFPLSAVGTQKRREVQWFPTRPSLQNPVEDKRPAERGWTSAGREPPRWSYKSAACVSGAARILQSGKVFQGLTQNIGRTSWLQCGQYPIPHASYIHPCQFSNSRSTDWQSAHRKSSQRSPSHSAGYRKGTTWCLVGMRLRICHRAPIGCHQYDRRLRETSCQPDRRRWPRHCKEINIFK